MPSVQKSGAAPQKSDINGKKFFYGYKLHGIIDMVTMHIVSLKITPANVSDVKALDEKMITQLSGVLVGDKGYISKQKTKQLLEQQLRLLTPSRKNMKQTPVSIKDLVLLGQRNRIESIWGALKNNWQLINRYARSTKSFLIKFLPQCLATL